VSTTRLGRQRPCWSSLAAHLACRRHRHHRMCLHTSWLDLLAADLAPHLCYRWRVAHRQRLVEAMNGHGTFAAARSFPAASWCPVGRVRTLLAPFPGVCCSGTWARLCGSISLRLRRVGGDDGRRFCPQANASGRIVGEPVLFGFALVDSEDIIRLSKLRLEQECLPTPARVAVREWCGSHRQGVAS